jgi:trimethylamine--corrinoid protein Co-methyltransferase
MLNNTSKPIVVVTPDFEGLKLAVEMAELVVGGAEALQRNPLMACYVNVTSGLVHNEEALQKLMFMSQRRLPFLYIPVSMGGLNAPATVAGCLAYNNAAVLLGLVLSQLVCEGAPYVVPAMGASLMNMRTMSFGIPDNQGIEAELAHYYNLPMFGIVGSSAKIVDQQAVLDTGLSIYQATLAGANIIHDLGYMEGGLTGSLALFVIAHELIGRTWHALRPIEVSEETLAVDVVHKVGPEGSFLDTDHTRRHYRKHWYPPTPEIFDRAKYPGWVAAGSTSMLERATARVDKILAEHQPDPLPEDVAAAVHAVVQRAEAALTK